MFWVGTKTKWVCAANMSTNPLTINRTSKLYLFLYEVFLFLYVLQKTLRDHRLEQRDVEGSAAEEDLIYRHSCGVGFKRGGRVRLL